MNERRLGQQRSSEQNVVEAASFRDPTRGDRRKAGQRVGGPDAGFLSQLLALRAGMPSQRTKRRADPQDGATAYHSSAQLGYTPALGSRLTIKA